jgi:ribonuclease BN (tRNA processing enzyme)
LREALLAMHTTTKEVGKIAAEADVKTLVLNHFVPGDDLSITDEMWRADPSKDFDGLLVVGRDLQTF